MQAYLRCLHCGRNQSRHLRTGRGNWTCRYCGELNPGPALSDRVLAVRRTKSKPLDEQASPASANGSKPSSAPATSPATPARVTRRRTGPQRPDPPARRRPEAKPAAAPAPAAAKTGEAKPKPEAKPGGFWDRLAWGGAE